MIDNQNKSLKFPKGSFKKQINGRTAFELVSETKLLPVAANWDTTLWGLQLDYLPALAQDGVGQTVANPVVTCTTDSTTRTVILRRPDDLTPIAGQVYLDIFSGTICFNSADAGKTFQVDYYKKASLIDHNGMNRIWEAGSTYVVGDAAYHDFNNLQDCFDACLDGDSVKLLKDINISSTSNLTSNKKITLYGNNRKVTKIGTTASARAWIFSADVQVRDLDFVGYSAAGDVCLFAAGDVRAIISTNKAIGCTSLTNAGTACTYSIVENNLPYSQNVNQSVTTVSNTVYNKVVKQFTSLGPINVNDPVYQDAFSSSVSTTTTLTDASILLGFALNSVAGAGQTVNVCIEGVMDGLSGLYPGFNYYINSSGVLTTATAGGQPQTNLYSPVSANYPTGSAYPFYVGQAINSSEIRLSIKKKNNLTRIDAPQLSGGANYALTPVASYSAGSPVNIFVTSGGSATNFNPGGKGWELTIPLVIQLIGVSGTVLPPSLQIGLEQELVPGSGVYFLVEKFIFGVPASGTTYSSIFTVDHKFRNENPGGGKCRIMVAFIPGAGGSASGTMVLRLPGPIKFNYIEQ